MSPEEANCGEPHSTRCEASWGTGRRGSQTTAAESAAAGMNRTFYRHSSHPGGLGVGRLPLGEQSGRVRFMIGNRWSALGGAALAALILVSAAAAHSEYNPVPTRPVPLGSAAGRLIVGFRATSTN